MSNLFLKLKKVICLFVYYSIAYYLPSSYSPILGTLSRKIRYQLCKRIFAKCGTNVNVERMVNFGSGRNIQIGDNSGMGARCQCPSNIVIGNDVMMGPNVHIFACNHNYNRTDIPMNQQGFSTPKPVVVGDDVWIGAFVKILPGRHIARGTILAAGCVLVKDFPQYSIVGGNPSKLIKSRILDDTI